MVKGGKCLLSTPSSSAVYPDGRVCISILHAPGDDPMGYESSAERWSPVQSVEKILLSVVSMLAGMLLRSTLHTLVSESMDMAASLFSFVSNVSHPITFYP